jgi:hypothetical protein
MFGDWENHENFGSDELQAEIDAQQCLADNRFKSHESGRESDKTHMAQLENGLATMRRELAAYREKSNREWAGLEQRVDGNSRSLTSLAHWLHKIASVLKPSGGLITNCSRGSH